MDLLLACVRARRIGGPELQLINGYLARLQPFCPASLQEFPTESALLDALERAARRTRPHLILADSRGKSLSSEEFAAHFGRTRDAGAQTCIFAIGPADGWSSAARARGDLTVSFGRITLPHELAAVIAAEQLYRASAILTGHPYHGGH